MNQPFKYMVVKRGFAGQLIAMSLGLCIWQAVWATGPAAKVVPYWLPLTQDELHDPATSALKLLQNPGEALSKLPYDGAGNKVDWVKAIEKGFVRPSASIYSNTQVRVLDLNVLLRNTGEMDMVLFPHKQHTEWLGCDTCHEELFKSKAGTTKFGMFDILNGEYCGRCHGAVAFPLTECKRCHNVPRTPIIIPSTPRTQTN